MRVKYIGAKPRKTDNVAGTGVVWAGYGDVQDVPDDAWPKLCKFPDVWEQVDDEADPLPGGGGLDPVDPAPTGDMASMSDAELKAFATMHGLKVDLRKRGESLRIAIEAAITPDGG